MPRPYPVVARQWARVSARSWIRERICGDLGSATGIATSRRRGSPSWRTGRMGMGTVASCQLSVASCQFRSTSECSFLIADFITLAAVRLPGFARLDSRGRLSPHVLFVCNRALPCGGGVEEVQEFELLFGGEETCFE